MLVTITREIAIAETGEKAQQALAQYPWEAVFPLKDGSPPHCWNSTNATSPARGGGRPMSIGCCRSISCGGPDEIVAQLKQCREQISAGVVDLSFQTPGSEGPDELMEALELFGKRVPPHIRDI